MKRTLTALAAALISASALVCAPARAQQPASPPANAAPGAQPPPAAGTSAPGAAASSTAVPAAAPSARSSRERTGAPTVRPPPVYRVELIVFRATSALGAPEDWASEAGTAPVTSTDADPGAAAPSDTQAAATGTQGGGAPGSSVLGTLPESEFQLDGIASRLRASGRYEPVAHIAWTQTASPWNKPVEIPLQSVGLNAEGITGTVALERGVYLHLVLNLRYAMSDPPAGLEAAPGTVFVLDESHRVRLKERNYFDHPAFGVIALVTSNQPPKQPPSRAAR